MTVTTSGALAVEAKAAELVCRRDLDERSAETAMLIDESFDTLPEILGRETGLSSEQVEIVRREVDKVRAAVRSRLVDEGKRG